MPFQFLFPVIPALPVVVTVHAVANCSKEEVTGNEDGRVSLPASATLRRGLWGAGVQTEDSVSDRPLETALSRLDEVRGSEGAEFAKVFDDLEIHYRGRLAILTEEEADTRAYHGRFVELSRELLQVERRTAIRLRNEGRINDELLRQIEREPDLDEARFLTGGAGGERN